MEVVAKLRYYRQSSRKIRLVADLIRGMDTKAALNQLQFLNKRAALPIVKLVKSALANAKNNFSLKEDNLFIKSIVVNQGPTLKRWRARAFGRAAEIRKRTSHVIVVLDEKIKTQPVKKEGGEKKAPENTGEKSDEQGIMQKEEKARTPLSHEHKEKKTKAQPTQKPKGGKFARKIYQRKSV